MRLYVNTSDFGLSVVSTNEVYFDSSESRLCFSTDETWYKINLDKSLASYILSHIMMDGYYNLSNYIAYPFDDSDYLEE